ncbi:MAG TPA: hypothetical protein P5121_38380, partial [Caldilineaceae bacterium]|nr:hypothetical protein [Caldilineaceae bacterium]
MCYTTGIASYAICLIGSQANDRYPHCASRGAAVPLARHPRTILTAAVARDSVRICPRQQRDHNHHALETAAITIQGLSENQEPIALLRRLPPARWGEDRLWRSICL